MAGTALLMIDMQTGYTVDDGVRDALGWPPIWRLDTVIAECAELLTAARLARIPVIYSKQMGSPAGSLAMNPRAVRHMQSRQSRVPVLSAAQQEYRREIIEAVAPTPEDLILEKTRHSFFAYTELDPVLRSLAIQRLIVAGLQTNVCVEATVRAALERNYDVALAEDAVSTDGPDLPADAPWDRAFTTPNYGRNPNYWNELLDAPSPRTP
ncbi:cysteine hydrolase family protein [Nocardia sp. NPDC088792]|uniref:cysteine hydrolase family protein n=1 Tax=Nocardia sp. NPDC088792 TaxID=3364332 RepID=UPI0037F61064